ncbi:Gfo/Idh/MocA family protein [Candidatus Epulonipiscium viviparus]|uniref:Gfo/Idh/MocA family protein n=1 Tax=Candidatus Epulonipiscium viviparus TaxID=420336 RepID=UPI0027381440|nr:Gfo/Idh/MocA family oxidoreductase [Candidatus Epulopiscium viviparus]
MNIGILGAGTIANKMAKTILEMDEAVAYAIAARDLKRAEVFKEQYGFEKAYGSYEEMLADENVELVYVATTHNCHYEQVKMCLLAGKHVLCEKSFTITAAEARELCELSEEKGLLLAEAMWTRYLPIYGILEDVLGRGEIGEISSAVVNFGGNLKKERVWKKELGGGALLDLGVYVLTVARLIFKAEIKKIVSLAVVNDDDIDYVDNIIIQFANNKTAILQANQTAIMSSRVEIFGSTGYIEMGSVMNPPSIKVYGPGQELRNAYKRPEQITGFEYEVLACIKAIREGKVEVEELPHKEMIYIMELMENLLKEWRANK